MNNNQITARMKSIRQTVQVTNAQKLVASSHIGKARRILRENAPYHERIRQAIAEVLAVSTDVSSGYLDFDGEFVPEKRGVLIISADRGLAGGYSNNIMKYMEHEFQKKPAAQIMVLGRLGLRYLTKSGYEIRKVYEEILDPPSFTSATELSDMMIKLLKDGEVDCFDVIYTKYISSVRMDPVMERLFPLTPDAFGTPSRLRGDVTFEPDPEQVLEMMIPKYVKGYLFGCLVHAWTSELASRIAAMDSAMRNGNEMLDALALEYNRARQGSITQEITEIVAGAASMKEED